MSKLFALEPVEILKKDRFKKVKSRKKIKSSIKTFLKCVDCGYPSNYGHAEDCKINAIQNSI